MTAGFRRVTLAHSEAVWSQAMANLASKATRTQGKAWERFRSPALALALAALFWSGNFVAGRALRGHVDPVTLNFLRWLIALALIAPFVWRSTAAQPAGTASGVAAHCRARRNRDRDVPHLGLSRAAEYDGNQRSSHAIARTDRDAARLGGRRNGAPDESSNRRSVDFDRRRRCPDHARRSHRHPLAGFQCRRSVDAVGRRYLGHLFAAAPPPAC